MIAARRAQGRIGDKQDALLERDGLVDLPVADRLDIGRDAAERGPVAPRIFEQRLVLGDPDVAPLACSQLSRMQAATCRPLPAPVPSPRKKPLR
jgi:hypothetical protein